MSKELPQELQAELKSLKILATIVSVCGAITILGIPWAILYGNLAVILEKEKLPNRKFLIFAAIATIPICVLIIPIFLEVSLVRIIKKTRLFTTHGPTAFKKNKAWEKLSFRKKYPLVLGMVAALILLVILAIPVSYTSTKITSLAYTTQTTEDGSLELGDSQVRQNGNNGQGLERDKQLKPMLAVLFNLDMYYSTSKLPTQVTQAPVDQIIAQGTKKYQYMWCSNGTYRYFTNEQFKDPYTGFTHKSEDNCANTGNGHMTGLADTAPPTPTTVYQPTSTYRPTYTTCHHYSYINQFSCTSY